MIPDNNNKKLNRNTEITRVYKCVLDMNVTCTLATSTGNHYLLVLDLFENQKFNIFLVWRQRESF